MKTCQEGKSKTTCLKRGKDQQGERNFGFWISDFGIEEIRDEISSISESKTPSAKSKTPSAKSSFARLRRNLKSTYGQEGDNCGYEIKDDQSRVHDKKGLCLTDQRAKVGLISLSLSQSCHEQSRQDHIRLLTPRR